MKKALYNIAILLIIFSVFYLAPIGNDYKNFNKFSRNITTFDDKSADLSFNYNDYSLENVEDLDDTYIKVTPDKDFLNEIVEKIDNAKKEVFLETYILTETRIQKALKRASDRWIEVKVILEKDVYKADRLNNKAFDYLKRNWIFTVWASDYFSLNHTKMLIIDDEVIVSTWNYSYSTFAKNRDFFVISKDRELVSFLKNVFFYDFYWKKEFPHKNEVILTPFQWDKIYDLIKKADKEILIYTFNINDRKFLSLLKSKAESGVAIKIVGPSFSEIKNNKKVFWGLSDAWILVSPLKKDKQHSKAILVDGEFLYLWSINFSYYSINKNREIWLIVANNDIIDMFKKQFLSDFKNN